VRNSADISAENMMIVDLVVEDDRFPGLTFSGDAKSIFEEMAALKPEVFAEETSDVSTRSLAKRESVCFYLPPSTLYLYLYTIFIGGYILTIRYS
jgi:hypothetical protein